MTQLITETQIIDDKDLDYDVIVIGAGISGLYQLYKLRELGLRVKVLEAGTGVGGTWYWNRYPGARFDSESYSYGYSFSDELLKEWDWHEHFASQPEILKYLQYVSEKFDLEKDIQFSSRVKSTIFNDDQRIWTTTLENGDFFISRFLISAVGILSEPTLPKVDGIESFKGRSFHTSRWPHEPIDLNDKKIAVIGTGASGVQTIQEVCKVAGNLTVFQRRPNWCAPLHNGTIPKDEMEEIRSSYKNIFQRCWDTVGGFLHTMDSRGTFEVSEKEREDFWEHLYQSRGFGIWQGNFKDMLIDPEANKLMSEFVANKIRSRVSNPKTAEKLIPKDHGFGTRRVPLETHYFESYNRDNVELIDLTETPILSITADGLKTTDREFEFDIIIYATGFNAITGSFDKIDIEGMNGLKLKNQWEKDLETFLGLQVSNFPNMFMVLGPHALLGNNPRSIEYNVEWITETINYMRNNSYTRAEATAEAVQTWADYVAEQGEHLLSNKVDSWMTGINTNVEGKNKRILARYSGTAQSYRKRCDEVAQSGYKELNLS